MSIEDEPQKYIKFNEDDIVIKKEEYDKLTEASGYIEYFKQPTFSESLGKFAVWALGGKDFDKIFLDEKFREHWFGMKTRLKELDDE